jgi:uncharacterized protein (DUF58 family)
MAEPRRRFRAPRQLKATREGWFYLGVVLMVGLGAINSGNNLLYLVLGLQLATIVASGLLSEAALRDLELETTGARSGRAGEEGRWWLRLHKRGGRFPSFALTVEALDGPARDARASVLRLAPNTSEELELRFTGPRRGRFLGRRLKVSTRFPFGLAEKSRELEVEQELFVFPRRAEAPPLPARELRRDGPQSAGRPGPGAEPLALRPWQSGDALSQIHWRKSAQGQGWIASVREREQERELEVELDVSASADPDALTRFETRCERALALAELALDRGFAVALHAGATRVPFGSGPRHRARLREALASVEPDLGGAR